jgi:hypothetical protein
MNPIFRLLSIYAALSVLLCGLTLMDWYPAQPNGWGQWLAFFLLILPAAAASELLGGRLLHNRLSRALGRHARESDCSWLRIGYGVVVLLSTCGVVVGAAWWLARSAEMA